jgi:hypothetical protein
VTVLWGSRAFLPTRTSRRRQKKQEKRKKKRERERLRVGKKKKEKKEKLFSSTLFGRGLAGEGEMGGD